MNHSFVHQDQIHSFSMGLKDGRLMAVIGETSYGIDFHEVTENRVSLIIEGQSFQIYTVRADEAIFVWVDGECYIFSIPGDDDAFSGGGERGAESELIIKAPMPGSLLKINVKQGDRIGEGQCLAIVEAMKMETELFSSVNGSVKKVHAKPGKQVDAGEIIIELERESVKKG